MPAQVEKVYIVDMSSVSLYFASCFAPIMQSDKIMFLNAPPEPSLSSAAEKYRSTTF